ncbi:MAG: RagB/SusD family nutrient uptake outer membrane protein [Muribaculaceae bacterium]|nr:RagB/SusD family nutrient uptake outer membrane protein [Muribaculaceae bacterium]
MKKHIILGLIAGSAVALSSCNDFLDDNRYPLDKQTDNPAYWTSSQNVQAQINTLYGNFTGYGNGASWVNDFYYQSLSDDQCSHIYSGEGTVFARWTYEAVPNSNSVWDASYIEVRRCNYIINNCNIDNEAQNAHYIAQARLIRAMQYYELVRALGDVPLVTEVLDPNSPELYGERTPRNTVMDFVLEDLNFAVDNLLTKSNKLEISVDMANAMKSEICLFEAAYAKYHQNDTERAKKFYTEVINACKSIMDSNYSICDDYQSIYNSVFTADTSIGTVSLLDNPEIIFMKGYQTGSLCHSAAAFLSAETPIAGMTKDAFDAYLFKDAKPLATTSLDKSDLPEPILDPEGNVTGFDISNALEVRDGRLAKTIDPKLAFGSKVSFQRPNSYSITSTTGYTICKYVNPKINTQQTVTANNNYTCAPIYWLAYTYCDYLEARAELDQIDNADIAMCVKPLWERAGIDTSNLSKAYLENMADPANNMGVSSLIWEIRRLRRCELMFDRNHRYWDLVRWHKLDLLDTNQHPNIALGANISNAPADLVVGVFTSNGYINGAASTAGTSVRTFTEREYLQPLGSTIINLYNDKGLELPQNPHW